MQEYTREAVEVAPLGSFVNISESPTDILDSLNALVSTVPNLSEISDKPSMRAEVYVFDLGRVSKYLEPNLWDMEEFMRKDAAKWY
jgi:hypothetical protein